MLTADPMTGYDLVKFFDGTVAYFWNAPHSQIYPELRRMEEAGLVTATTVNRGERATKRVYQITEAGIEEVRRWQASVEPLPLERNGPRLKSAYAEWGTYDAIRRQLQEHLNHYTEYERQWRQVVADIDSRQVPLMRRRLEHMPETMHAAIIAFKRLAFAGEVARAEAEIAWARQGLALVDQLESSGAAIPGEVKDLGALLGGAAPEGSRTRRGRAGSRGHAGTQ
jgi:PadR family transcriptional regulator, regulator of vanillate utilization